MAAALSVFKYGGSSVGNANAIKAVCEHISKSTERCIPVVSAMYGITDVLLCDTTKSEAKREQVVEIHKATARELLEGNAYRAFETYLDINIREALHLPLHHPVLASMGERLSSRLVAAHLNETGTASVHVEDVVITDKHGTPLLARSEPVCNAMLTSTIEDGKVPVVAGYYARSVDGQVTLLGRGGTDLTAAVVAHAMDANKLVLWKVECDKESEGGGTSFMKEWIPGYVGLVHQADPTHTIERVHYKHASELAKLGKKVLHPDTVFPVIDKNIPIEIKNTLDPKQAGSTIDGFTPISSQVTVASKGDLIALVGQQDVHEAVRCVNVLEENRIEARLDASYRESLAIRLRDETGSSSAVSILHSMYHGRA